MVGIDAVGPALEDCCFLFIWLHTSCTKGHPEAITLVRAVHYADHFHEIVASHIAAFICLSAAIVQLILIVLRGINHQLRLDLDWDQARSLRRVILGNIRIDVVSLRTYAFQFF